MTGSFIIVNIAVPDWLIYVMLLVATLILIPLIWCVGIDRTERRVSTKALLWISIIILLEIVTLFIGVKISPRPDHWRDILDNIQSACRVQWEDGELDAVNGTLTINSLLGKPRMSIPITGIIKFERNGAIYELDTAKCAGKTRK